MPTPRTPRTPHAPGDENTAQLRHASDRAEGEHARGEALRLRRPARVTMYCKSLLREHTAPRHPATHPLHPATPPPRHPAPPHPRTPPHAWRFAHNPRPTPHAPRRSRADLNPTPTASPLMRSPMAHARRHMAVAAWMSLCLSAHLSTPIASASSHPMASPDPDP